MSTQSLVRSGLIACAAVLAAFLLGPPGAAAPGAGAGGRSDVQATNPQPREAGAPTPQAAWGLRQTPVVEVIRRAKDAVVNIHSERTAAIRRTQGLPPGDGELYPLTPSQHRVNGMGTGIVIDGRGYIVTNQHVVDEVQILRVRLSDGTTLPARVLARDIEHDLALIKINPPRLLPTLPMGTARDLMVGETVVAIGNAYGYDHTVTVGVVSAIGRDVSLNKSIRYRSLIQTDASINPGNSGGPLLNANGELVGINVAIRAGAQGIGFAIPADTLVRVVGSMLGQIAPTAAPAQQGWTLTDEVSAPTTERPSVRRVVVERVLPGSAAARAGLRQGDVLVSVTRPGSSARPVQSSLDPICALLEGTTRIDLAVRRAGAIQTVALETSRGAPPSPSLTARQNPPAANPPAPPRPSAPAGATRDSRIWRQFGIRVQSVGAPTLGLPRGTSQLRGGLVVLDLHPAGPAARSGVRAGDILVGLHQWEMLEPDNLLYVLDRADRASFSPLRFFIVRDGQIHRGTVAPLD